MTTELEHIHAAMRRAAEMATATAVTLRLGKVTAVTNADVTITIDGGDPIPGVPVLHPYVARVNDVVRVAMFGNNALVLGGLSIPNAVEAKLATNSSYSISTTASSSFSTPFRVAFVAPRSGNVTVTARARITSTTTARAIATVRLLDASLATYVSESASMLEVAAGAGTTTQGAETWFTGLTPGDTYYAELVAASGVAGQVCTFSALRLHVIPER